MLTRGCQPNMQTTRRRVHGWSATSRNKAGALPGVNRRRLVAQDHIDAARQPAAVHLDPAARQAVTHCVVDEVVEHLAQQQGVTRRGQAALDLGRQGLVGERHLRIGQQIVQQIGQVQRRHVQRQPAGIGLRRQQLARDAGQPAHLVQHVGQAGQQGRGLDWPICEGLICDWRVACSMRPCRRVSGVFNSCAASAEKRAAW